MNMLVSILLTGGTILIACTQVEAQIVEKYSGVHETLSSWDQCTYYHPHNLDIDNDGFEDFLLQSPNQPPAFFNVVTGEVYSMGYPMNMDIDEPTPYMSFGRILSENSMQAVFCNWGFPQETYVMDVMSEEVVLTWNERVNCVIMDFDNDGLGDIIRIDDNTFTVYGVPYPGVVFPDTPDPVSIQVSSGDILLSWEEVGTAVGYKILYASEFDSSSFLQVGFNRTNSFRHIGFADVPRGFYKIISVAMDGSQNVIAISSN